VSAGKANLSTVVFADVPPGITPPAMYPATPEFAKPANERLVLDSPVPKVVLVSAGKANLSTVAPIET
jgi:hypothetical protein